MKFMHILIKLLCTCLLTIYNTSTFSCQITRTLAKKVLYNTSMHISNLRAILARRATTHRRISTAKSPFYQHNPNCVTSSAMNQHESSGQVKRNSYNTLLGASLCVKRMFESDINQDNNETSCVTNDFVRLAVQAAQQTESFKKCGLFPEDWRKQPAIIQPTMFNRYPPLKSDFMYKILSLIPWDGKEEGGDVEFNVLCNQRCMRLYICNDSEYWHRDGPRGVRVDLSDGFQNQLEAMLVWREFEKLKGIKK